jgi:hypothetical protein
MTIDRSLWQLEFRELPPWPCPTCQRGSLSLVPKTLCSLETGPSKKACDHEAWDPEWTVKRFVCHVRCGNSACGEICCVAGHIRTDWDYIDHPNGHSGIETYNFYRPTHIHPAPPIIRVHNEDYPESVREQLHRLFGLFWIDRRAAATALRSSVEAFLSHRKVTKTRAARGGKRAPLNLAARIDAYVERDPSADRFLHAIRWLGNYSTHEPSSEMEPGRLLDAIDMFDLLLEDTYVRRKRMKRLAIGATAIVKSKGKPSRPRPPVRR